ncbi:MAG: Hsp33 family molecular chaperone HslO [Rhodospirillaceae bacterium]
MPVVIAAAEDMVLSFQLMGGAFRGRLVRAGGVAADMIGPHAYPPAVAHLLAETLADGAAMASGLKYEGIFTLQIQGNGPVHTLVVDMDSTGAMRGLARFDPDDIRLDDALAALNAAALEAGGSMEAGPFPGALATLVGEGTIAFTVDQGAHTDRYQGITALEGGTVSACVEAYFQQSEQVSTLVRSAVRPGLAGSLGAVCLMVQRMPGFEATQPQSGQQGGGQMGEDWSEAWNRAKILGQSLTDSELLDAGLDAQSLLRRPFHGEELAIDENLLTLQGAGLEAKFAETMVAHFAESTKVEEAA